MSAAKYFLIGAGVLFAGVGLVGVLKRPPKGQGEKGQGEGIPAQTVSSVQVVQEIALPAPKASPPPKVEPPKPELKALPVLPKAPPPAPPQEAAAAAAVGFPDADRIRQLYATDSSKLPIVETVSYTSRVPWIQGRPAWIADYASHYNTSRHFIARSLNKKADYLTQKISPGDRFNVFKKDKNLQFYFVADLSRCKMWFYYLDIDSNERVLLKTYPIGIGRADPKRKSGSLTPTGKYSFGDKIAIYKPGTLGYFQDRETEMVRVFGTRWIPFGEELEGCTEPAKGYGLHGSPWTEDPGTRQWSEDNSKIGKCDSDGCIRLSAEDIEEIFSIVITKPSVIELVKDFRDAKLPGVEKNP